MPRLTWTVLKESSHLSFRFSYFEISHIAGQVLDFSAEVITNEYFDHPEIYVFINSLTIETYQLDQNELLRSPQSLSVERFPFIEFSSVDGCTLRSGRIWELSGDLRIKEIKKPLTLLLNYSAIQWHNRVGRAQFRLFGEFSRSDFGLDCNSGRYYGDTISISADLVLETRID